MRPSTQRQQVLEAYADKEIQREFIRRLVKGSSTQTLVHELKRRKEFGILEDIRPKRKRVTQVTHLDDVITQKMLDWLPRHLDISLPSLQAHTRDLESDELRALFMATLRSVINLRFDDVAKACNRGHATAMNACRRVSEDEVLSNKLEMITAAWYAHLKEEDEHRREKRRAEKEGRAA